MRLKIAIAVKNHVNRILHQTRWYTLQVQNVQRVDSKTRTVNRLTQIPRNHTFTRFT